LNAGADDFLFAPLLAPEVRARVRTGARIVEVEQALRASQSALRVQSTRDGVTGSWNHAAILDMLQKERERSRRKSGSVGVVLADLDELKKVNDELGHGVGDEVLREAARRMNSSVRPLRRGRPLRRRRVPDRAARLGRARRPDRRGAHPRVVLARRRSSPRRAPCR
jgi:PleD family two-component response regulator